MHAREVSARVVAEKMVELTPGCSLDGVIRAYVHTDYSSFNPAQHTSRKQQPPTSKLAITPSRISADEAASEGSITPTNKRPVIVEEQRGRG